MHSKIFIVRLVLDARLSSLAENLKGGLLYYLELGNFTVTLYFVLYFHESKMSLWKMILQNRPN